MCKTHRWGSSDYDQYGSRGFDKSPNGRLDCVDTQVAGGCYFLDPILGCAACKQHLLKVAVGRSLLFDRGGHVAGSAPNTHIAVTGYGFLPHGCVFVWTRL